MSSIDDSFSRIALASASSAEYKSRLDPSDPGLDPPEGDFESPERDDIYKKTIKKKLTISFFVLTVFQVVLRVFR